MTTTTREVIDWKGGHAWQYWYRTPAGKHRGPILPLTRQESERMRASLSIESGQGDES